VGSDVPLKKAGRVVTSLSCQLSCQLPCQGAPEKRRLRDEGGSERQRQEASCPDSSGSVAGADVAQLGELMRDLAAELVSVTHLVAELCDAFSSASWPLGSSNRFHQLPPLRLQRASPLWNLTYPQPASSVQVAQLHQRRKSQIGARQRAYSVEIPGKM